MGQPLIKVGSTGEAVMYLQQSLTKLGYNLGIIDGIFGSKLIQQSDYFKKLKD
ncbi:peptidoglycan-binding protein [Clostridium psychrophilum]|nr:peptidoglycan-binding domain-containing protein [Clostridium psychrophilum]MBU3182561.1 peptidoglycan-binding protein [Clostridium psychrophilum]